MNDVYINRSISSHQYSLQIGFQQISNSFSLLTRNFYYLYHLSPFLMIWFRPYQSWRCSTWSYRLFFSGSRVRVGQVPYFFQCNEDLSKLNHPCGWLLNSFDCFHIPFWIVVPIQCFHILVEVETLAYTKMVPLLILHWKRSFYQSRDWIWISLLLPKYACGISIYFQGRNYLRKKFLLN